MSKVYEIPLPPLEEQRRIVAEIEGYQKVLDGARQILAGYRLGFLESNPDWPTWKLGEVARFEERIQRKPSQRHEPSKSHLDRDEHPGKIDIAKFEML